MEWNGCASKPRVAAVMGGVIEASQASLRGESRGRHLDGGVDRNRVVEGAW